MLDCKWALARYTFWWVLPRDIGGLEERGKVLKEEFDLAKARLEQQTQDLQRKRRLLKASTLRVDQLLNAVEKMRRKEEEEVLGLSQSFVNSPEDLFDEGPSEVQFQGEGGPKKVEEVEADMDTM